ncbi:ubiquitin hydrolase, putative,cysteine peptidase, Clan CA, family C19, partial [Trypanosoma cruzi]
MNSTAASTFPQRTLTGGRRRVNTQTSQDNFGRPHLPHSMPLPFHTFPLEHGFGAEDQVLHFLALDVNTWAPRVWNDVVSGVLVDLRCAYGYYWHRGDAHAQIAIDGFVSCRRALEIDREPTDQFMDFGRALPQDFPDADCDNN